MEKFLYDACIFASYLVSWYRCFTSSDKVRGNRFDMRIRIVYIFLLISVSTAFSQQVQHIDAVSLALSGSDGCYYHTWNGIRNSATLASIPGSMLGINYYNRYLIPELGSQSIFGTLRFQGTWGYSLSYFGTKAFNESTVSASYGRHIFRWLDAGITMKGHHLAVEALSGRSFSITGDMGIITRPGKGISLGLHMVNPNRSGYMNMEQDNLPAEMNLSITWNEPGDFYLAAQLHWRDYSDLFLSMGSEYRMGKTLALRAGLKVGDLLSYSYGLAFDFRKLNIALGFEQHTCLGLSSAVTMVYKFSAHDE